MARIEMDCNLTKLANFFQVFPVYFGEIAETTDDNLFFPGEIP